MRKVRRIDRFGDGKDVYQLDLNPGQRFAPDRPVLEFTTNGRLTYLWIGGNEPGRGFCFGVAEGSALKDFATKLLRAMDGKPIRPARKKRKTP